MRNDVAWKESHQGTTVVVSQLTALASAEEREGEGEIEGEGEREGREREAENKW